MVDILVGMCSHCARRSQIMLWIIDPDPDDGLYVTMLEVFPRGLGAMAEVGQA